MKCFHETNLSEQTTSDASMNSSLSGLKTNSSVTIRVGTKVYGTLCSKPRRLVSLPTVWSRSRVGVSPSVWHRRRMPQITTNSACRNPPPPPPPSRAEILLTVRTNSDQREQETKQNAPFREAGPVTADDQEGGVDSHVTGDAIS